MKNQTMKNQANLFPFGGPYIGVAGGGDANTNEILYRALIELNFSPDPDPVRKDYKKELINVWAVTSKFVRMLYEKKKDFKLKFIIYAELNFVMQRFRILEPAMMKKAQEAARVARLLRKSKAKQEGSVKA